MIILIFLKSIAVAVVSASKVTTTSKPAHQTQVKGLWPLDSVHQAQDVSGNKNSGSFSDVRYGDGPTGYKQTATRFLGKNHSFAEMPSVKSSLDVGTGPLTFMAYVFFDHVINGTIMAWGGAKPSDNGVKLYVEDNDLRLSIFSRHAAYQQREKTYTYMRIIPQVWLFLGFAYNQKIGVLRAWVNDWQRWETVGSMEVETGGSLFLGGHWTGGKAKHLPLSGRMSCAMVFAENLDGPDAFQQMSKCLKMHVSGHKERVSEALANWPLDKNHLTTDSGIFNVQGDPSDLLEADGPSSRRDGALLFKGKKLSNITVPNEFGILDTDKGLTVMGYMYRVEEKDGVVLGWYGGKNASNSLRLEVAKGILRVRVTDKNGTHRVFPPLSCTDTKKSYNKAPKTSNCKHLEVPKGEWDFVGVTYNDGGNLTMWVNSDFISFDIGKSAVRTKGQFFMGGQPKNGVVLPAVRIRLSCISVFAVALNRTRANHHVESCLRSWNLHEKYTNPIAFWPLDLTHGPDDRGAYHLNGVINDLALADGPTGRPESSYLFSGTTKSYIEIDNQDEILDFQKGTTVLAFIHQNKPHDGVIFEWAGDSTLSKGVQLRILRGAVDVNLVARGGKIVESYPGQRVKPGQWNQVGFSYSASRGEIKLWLNDWEPVIRSTGKHLLETRGNVYIGGRPDERYSQGFRGQISCVMVFEEALKAPDVHHAGATCTGRLMFYYNPIALWPMSASHKNQDLAGYGNTGKAENVDYAEGPNKKPGTAMSFKGHTDSGFIIPEKDVLDTRYGTSFVAWVYLDRKDSTDETLFSWNGKLAASKGITIGIDKNRALFADIYRQRYIVNVMLPLELRQWYMIGFSYNAHTGIFYLWTWDRTDHVNGAELYQGRVIIETRGGITIGTKPPTGTSRSFKGRMSCVMLFNKPAHVQKLVMAGKKCETYMLSANKPHRITPGKKTKSKTNSHHHLGSIIAPTIILVLLGTIVVFTLIFYKKRQSGLEYSRARYRSVLNPLESEQTALL